MKNQGHCFERALEVSAEEVAASLRFLPAPWADFLLNPRRLRGSDFLMRWSQGVWSEQRLVQAVANTGRYLALPYGPSGTAPQEDVRAFELYFERLEQAGLGKLKRPDLLIFRTRDQPAVDILVQKLGGIGELPFTSETEARMQDLLGLALLAIECENSLWVAKRMPDYATPLTPQRRLGGQLGLKKTAVTPTVIVKEEDRTALHLWQSERNVPIHIWHAFYDLAFGLALDRFEELVAEGQIEPTVQTFQAPGGATTRKIIYKTYHHHAYALGEMTGDVALVAQSLTDANGHILPYVRFEGGRLSLVAEAIAVLEDAARSRFGTSAA